MSGLFRWGNNVRWQTVEYPIDRENQDVDSMTSHDGKCIDQTEALDSDMESLGILSMETITFRQHLTEIAFGQRRLFHTKKKDDR